MSRKPRRRRSPRAAWERGYRGHVLWQGREKLGRVTREAEKRYVWEAAGRGGVAQTLPRARAAVEAAVAMKDRQMDLFG